MYTSVVVARLTAGCRTEVVYTTVGWLDSAYHTLSGILRSTQSAAPAEVVGLLGYSVAVSQGTCEVVGLLGYSVVSRGTCEVVGLLGYSVVSQGTSVWPHQSCATRVACSTVGWVRP